MLLPQKFFIIFTVRKVGRAWQNLHWNNFMFYIYQKYFTKIILILVLFLFFKKYWFNHKLSVIWFCSLGNNQIYQKIFHQTQSFLSIFGFSTAGGVVVFNPWHNQQLLWGSSRTELKHSISHCSCMKGGYFL